MQKLLNTNKKWPPILLSFPSIFFVEKTLKMLEKIKHIKKPTERSAKIDTYNIIGKNIAKLSRKPIDPNLTTKYKMTK
jgi:hypothetical protein